jgi:hypothetical protein
MITSWVIIDLISRSPYTKRIEQAVYRSNSGREEGRISPLAFAISSSSSSSVTNEENEDGSQTIVWNKEPMMMSGYYRD